jgi:hypothetical protein
VNERRPHGPDSAMPIYTAEINGRGIAAFDTADLVAAEDWAHSTVFLEDLFRLEADGARLWDGVAEICVRPALPEEEAKWPALYCVAMYKRARAPGSPSWCPWLTPLASPVIETPLRWRSLISAISPARRLRADEPVSHAHQPQNEIDRHRITAHGAAVDCGLQRVEPI